MVEEEPELEFFFSASATKRGYTEAELQKIIERDPDPLEQGPANANPGGVRYIARGWSTRTAEYVEVGLVAPWYGAAVLVVHAMPCRQQHLPAHMRKG